MYRIGDKVIVKDKTDYQESAEKYIGCVGEIEDISDTCDSIFIKGFTNEDGYLIEWDIDEVMHVAKEIILFVTDSGNVIPYMNNMMLKNDDLQHKTVNELVQAIIKYPACNTKLYRIEFSYLLYRYIVASVGVWSDTEAQQREFNSGCLFADKEKAQQIANKFNKILREGM